MRCVRTVGTQAATWSCEMVAAREPAATPGARTWQRTHARRARSARRSAKSKAKSDIPSDAARYEIEEFAKRAGSRMKLCGWPFCCSPSSARRASATATPCTAARTSPTPWRRASLHSSPTSCRCGSVLRAAPSRAGPGRGAAGGDGGGGVRGLRRDAAAALPLAALQLLLTPPPRRPARAHDCTAARRRGRPRGLPLCCMDVEHACE